MKNKYIIVGKAASGKDWLQIKMREKGYHLMKQYTTRAIRDNETGEEYHFIDDDTFNILRSSFVSVNFYAIGWYAISLEELKNCDVAILSPANVKDIFENNKPLRDEFTIIYLDMPIDLRRKRLNNRYLSKVGDDNERRIAADERDFANFNEFDIRFCSPEEIETFVNNLSPISNLG